MTDENNKNVCDMAMEHGLADGDFLSVYSSICEALFAKFGKENVDSGVGGGWADLHVRHEGVEYHLLMKTHRSLKAPS